MTGHNSYTCLAKKNPFLSNSGTIEQPMRPRKILHNGEFFHEKIQTPDISNHKKLVNRDRSKGSRTSIYSHENVRKA